MSNQVRRGVLRGTILNDGQPVGAIDVPEPHEEFVAEFNRLYASAGLQVCCETMSRDLPDGEAGARSHAS